MSWQAARKQLLVAGGELDGARMDLPAVGSVVVGSGLDCDVVLRDASVGDSRVEIELLPLNTEFEVTSGEVMVDGVPRRQGERGIVGASGINMGGCSIQILDAGESEDAPRVDGQSSEGADAAHLLALPAETASDEASEFNSMSSSSPSDSNLADRESLLSRFKLPVIAAAFLGVVVGAVLLELRTENAQNPPVDTLSAVSELLDSSDYAEVSVVETANGLSVQGFVKNRQEAIALERMLAASGHAVDNDVESIESLVAQLEDIFRVNGVTAEVTATDAGTLTVETSIADDAIIARVREVVADDMPQLQAWDINNVPPPLETMAATVPPPAIDPGKRVAMVVSDDPAYVLTEDQSRYFIGSVLPSGHRIASIEDGRVSLTKQGVVTELEF